MNAVQMRQLAEKARIEADTKYVAKRQKIIQEQIYCHVSMLKDRMQRAARDGKRHYDVYHLAVDWLCPWREYDLYDWRERDAQGIPILEGAALAIWNELQPLIQEGYRRSIYHHNFSMSPDKTLDEMLRFSIRLEW